MQTLEQFANRVHTMEHVLHDEALAELAKQIEAQITELFDLWRELGEFRLARTTAERARFATWFERERIGERLLAVIDSTKACASAFRFDDFAKRFRLADLDTLAAQIRDYQSRHEKSQEPLDLKVDSATFRALQAEA